MPPSGDRDPDRLNEKGEPDERHQPAADEAELRVADPVEDDASDTDPGHRRRDGDEGGGKCERFAPFRR